LGQEDEEVCSTGSTQRRPSATPELTPVTFSAHVIALLEETWGKEGIFFV